MFAGSSENVLLGTVSRNEQRQGITMAVVPCLLRLSLLYARFRSITAYVRTQSVRMYAVKGKVLAYRGVLSTDGMVYSAQQIEIYRRIARWIL